MKDNIEKKIEALINKAKENAHTGKIEVKKDSNFPNSLSDKIKTKEEAKAFMLLLKSQ